jgi:uncharacterized membrane protein
MVLMALDHARDYFSSAAIDPTDPVNSWPALFITRWATHICAPGFILLAGASVDLQRQRRSAATLTRALILRGLWLIFLEITVVSFGWSFGFGMPILQVIWVIGVCMIAMAGLQWLPMPAVGLFGAIVILGHNLRRARVLSSNSVGMLIANPFLAPCFCTSVFTATLPISFTDRSPSVIFRVLYRKSNSDR